MSAHTPGPWRFKKNYKGDFEVGDANSRICTIEAWSEDVDKADARLIAAAPDLLFAVLNAPYRTPAMEAAIAKVEGK